MRTIKQATLLLASILTIGTASYGQNQIANLEGINYQAVAIDEDGKEIVGTDIKGKPLYEKEIGVRFTIDNGPAGVVSYYQDEHTTTTDKYGLFSLTIGLGTTTGIGDYDTLLNIPWINGDQWLMVEIAIENDGNYRLVNHEKFMAVPFSFYTDDIADNSITTFKIVDETIKAVDIDTSAVETSEILNETIQAEDIDTGAVTTSEILDSTILNIDISTGAVDSRTILNETIQAEDIDTGAVTTSEILDLTILNEDISTGAVDSRTILNETILAEDIATGAVETSEILDLTILNQDIANGTIDLTTKVNGILPVQNGGTGLDGSAAANGTLLIGNGTGYSLDSLTAGIGISISNTPGNITISAGLPVNTNVAGNVNPNNITSGSTWISPAIPLAGVVFGNIVIGSLDTGLQGCQLTTYVTNTNIIKVSIFNGTGGNVNLGNGLELRVLVVQ